MYARTHFCSSWLITLCANSVIIDPNMLGMAIALKEMDFFRILATLYLQNTEQLLHKLSTPLNCQPTAKPSFSNFIFALTMTIIEMRWKFMQKLFGVL